MGSEHSSNSQKSTRWTDLMWQLYVLQHWGRGCRTENKLATSLSRSTLESESEWLCWSVQITGVIRRGWVWHRPTVIPAILRQRLQIKLATSLSYSTLGWGGHRPTVIPVIAASLNTTAAFGLTVRTATRFSLLWVYGMTQFVVAPGPPTLEAGTLPLDHLCNPEREREREMCLTAWLADVWTCA